MSGLRSPLHHRCRCDQHVVRHARPGLHGPGEIADHTARIRDAVELPLLVDADTGFGNALNVYHTVRTLERAGADCIQLEDQVAPKRCGHFAGKDVISTEEAVSKNGRIAQSSMSLHQGSATGIGALSTGLIVKGARRSISTITLTSENYCFQKLG